MRTRPAAIGLWIVVVAAAPAAAQRVPPTDVRAVETLIDAPHALFGRTRAAAVAALGLPVAERVRTVRGGAGAPAEVLHEMTYPGLVLGLSPASATLRRVEMTEPRFTLPGGVNVGTTREAVEAALGEAQRATDVSALYTYADGFPYTVELHFRDGRVQRIEWRYAAGE